MALGICWRPAMKNNVFWLLFSSVAIGVSLCALVLYFSILFAIQQDQVLDFSDDVQDLRNNIEDVCSLKNQEACIDEMTRHTNFESEIHKTKPSISNDVISESETQLIYEHEEQLYQSLILIQLRGSTSPLWLLVKDQYSFDDKLIDSESLLESEDMNEQEDMDEYEIALAGAFYGVFFLLGTLAASLYFPLKRLNVWLSEIEQASRKIGNQNYDFYLSEDKIQPLGEFAVSFNRMVEKIKSHAQEKNILANAIAHELRTPLTRFHLVLGLLARQPMDKIGQELLLDLERYTNELETITDNTLRLATLRDSKITLQKFRLHDVLKNQQKKFKTSFPSLSVDVDVEAIEIETDIDFLQLALDNLISNACHYARNKIHIKQWRDSHQVYIQISDDGPGIPQQDIEYVQQAFARLDNSRDRKTGGTGLGLAIVRLAVQRLQGELVFKSVEQGTCIVLTLPLKHIA